MRIEPDEICAEMVHVDCAPDLFETPRSRMGPAAVRPATDPDKTALEAARGVVLLSTAREKSFPGGIFYDPAWELLIELFIADASGRRFSVTDVCTVRGIAATTGQRYLRRLAALGLIVRVADPDDGRRTLLALRSSTRQNLVALLNEMAEAVAPRGGSRPGDSAWD